MNFSALPLAKPLLKNLDTLGFHSMTEIQQQSLPDILAGHDVLAQAKTGSGKTAAFGLGILHHLKVKQFRIQSLVLCPTRELADQVAKEIRRLARAIHNIKVLTLCGGMPIGPQLGSLEHGAHIIVGTPGRIEEHLRKGSLDLRDVTTVVLDEADRMLDMGFRDVIEDIIDFTPSKRQTLLFSATYPKDILALSQQYQKQPKQITVEAVHTNQVITQHFVKTEKQARLETLIGAINHFRPEAGIVFCNTKAKTAEVAEYLSDHGFSALAIHGDLSQKDRDQVLVRFANNSCSFLVATDVAARGLDIKELPAVINFEMTRDAEVHVHRIGRTGRSGSEGMAINLFTQSEEYKVADVEAQLNQSFTPVSAQEFDGETMQSIVPPMVTLQIDGGKKQKVRPGDILGALTKDAGLAGSAIGKIDIFDFNAYVAVERSVAHKALNAIKNGQIKGKKFKVRRFR